MKLALVVHETRAEAHSVAERVAASAQQRGLEVAVTVPIAERAGMDHIDVPPTTADVVLAVGGNGTVLRAVQVGLVAEAPVFGINVGRVGFLADVEPRQLEAALDVLASGQWTEQSRMTIEATVNQQTPEVGVNDVVVEKVTSQRLISLEVLVDGEPFLTYHADGLVVSTSTGSTAYNLSAGGPLVDPELDALVLTPVAPHSLFSKPIVFTAETVLTARVTEDRPVGVNIDGNDLGTFQPGDEIVIRRGAQRARFINASGRSFPRRVLDKFRLTEPGRS